MRLKVTGKQENSRMCFICGLKNPYGLHGAFYALENRDLVCIFTPRDQHQGYPGRLHGGISTAVLDETIGRAVNLEVLDMAWGVTVELSVKFRRPVPIGVQLRAVGRIRDPNARFFVGTGEILLPDGTVAVEAKGRYLRVPVDKIGGFDSQAEDWRVVASTEDPASVDLPTGARHPGNPSDPSA